ncbi:MAG: hypothetical protein NWF09_03620 [Candidatus Bathyarchaeota archaeon]|nr:hypothetical protein [Candidatus Bathyarchaeota archaeon]
MSTKKKNQKPKKVNLLNLTNARRTYIIKKAKETLRQQRLEAEFWQSLAEVERLTINGCTIDFENGTISGLTTGELLNL